MLDSRAKQVLKAVALITTFGVLSYAAYVNTLLRPPRFDEAYLLMLNRHAASYSRLFALSYDGAIETPVHPLLVMSVTRLFPTANDLVVAREFSVVCMALSVLLAFVFLRKNFGVFTASLGCLMFAASEFFWFSAIDGRNYALATALAVCAIWAWDKRQPLWDVVSAAAMLLGLFTHYFSLFVLIACAGSVFGKELDAKAPASQHSQSRSTRLSLLAAVLVVFIVAWGPNIIESIRAREGATGIWNEQLSVGRLLEYSIGLPWIPKAGVLSSVLLLCALVAALIRSPFQMQTEKQVHLDGGSFLLTRHGLLLLLLFLPGLILVVITASFHHFDFVARYFFVTVLGLNLFLATLIGQFWQKARRSTIHYVLFSLTFFFLIGRVFYPVLAHSQMRASEATFLSQVRTLDSLGQHQPLLFDVSYLDFRFFWQVCWASPTIERLAKAPVHHRDGGPGFLTKYYQHFDTPRFVHLEAQSAAYNGHVLISSDADRAWNKYYPDLCLEPLVSVGEGTGGFVMNAYRISHSNDSPLSP